MTRGFECVTTYNAQKVQRKPKPSSYLTWQRCQRNPMTRRGQGRRRVRRDSICFTGLDYCRLLLPRVFLGRCWEKGESVGGEFAD